MTYSQQSIDSVICKMREDIFSRPSELIYLQTGKDIYETGEDLWFKAYQLDVQTFGLSDKMGQRIFLVGKLSFKRIA